MTRYPISYQNGGKMAKINTLFMTKTVRFSDLIERILIA